MGNFYYRRVKSMTIPPFSSGRTCQRSPVVNGAPATRLDR
jgi:hypothetical protein